jgi:hypothetical protein
MLKMRVSEVRVLEGVGGAGLGRLAAGVVDAGCGEDPGDGYLEHEHDGPVYHADRDGGGVAAGVVFVYAVSGDVVEVVVRVVAVPLMRVILRSMAGWGGPGDADSLRNERKKCKYKLRFPRG